MKVLLICVGGVSTSILAANIRKYANQDDLIEALPESELNNIQKKYDVVLVAPQIKYMVGSIAKKQSQAVIETMSEKDYGRLKGKAVYEQAKRLACQKKDGEEGEQKMKQIKVTLCCNGGVSTKMLVKKIVDAAQTHGFEIECDAYPVTRIAEAAPGSDIILIGPQIKFMAKELQNRYPDIPVDVIDMRDYGSMNGKKIFEDALKKYNW